MTDTSTLASPASTAGCCPLCGQTNLCAIEAQRASGQPQPPCWCVTAVFSADLLARVPAHLRNQACICAKCVTAQAQKTDGA